MHRHIPLQCGFPNTSPFGPNADAAMKHEDLDRDIVEIDPPSDGNDGDDPNYRESSVNFGAYLG